MRVTSLYSPAFRVIKRLQDLFVTFKATGEVDSDLERIILKTVNKFACFTHYS